VAAAPPGTPLVVRITALRLPQELPTADVASQEDLERLAAAYSLAILRDLDTDYVLYTGIVFRYERVAAQVVRPREARRRPSPQGRDWVYRRADVIDIDSRREAVSSR
jgi:hypothetical protein